MTKLPTTKLHKWNAVTGKYEDVDVPDDWNVKTYYSDMNAVLRCPGCGKKCVYGDCYCSHIFQTELGLGYPVCASCYACERE